MRVSVLLFSLVASAFTLSPAKATSLTIDFPTAGDFWGEIASGTSGTLSGGGYTGQLKSAGSYVTSSGNTYPVLNNFVATGLRQHTIFITLNSTRLTIVLVEPAFKFSSPIAAVANCIPRDCRPFPRRRCCRPAARSRSPWSTMFRKRTRTSATGYSSGTGQSPSMDIMPPPRPPPG